MTAKVKTSERPPGAELSALLEALPRDAMVLDYGCFGWPVHALAHALGRTDLVQGGCDFLRPKEIPEGASFYEVVRAESTVNCEDDKFDLVVLSHVIEHVADPLRLFGEVLRVCKPGGKIYVEAPSDKSIQVGSSAKVEGNGFLSFWDDPTHIRPWTPAALYRLGISYGCRPLVCAYISSFHDKILYPFRFVRALLTKDMDSLTPATWAARKWSCCAVFEKDPSVHGKPEYRYISLKSVPYGVDHALALYDCLKGT